MFRWLRWYLSATFFLFSLFALYHYETTVYLLHQGRGQLAVLAATESPDDYMKRHSLSEAEKRNLQLIDEVKRYSVDSLGYEPTDNYTRVFDQKDKSTLWVITACKPYAFEPYYWRFPLVGEVSYKGFFKKTLATPEYNHLRAMGYDVDLRSVSAWSTLGWCSDPVLSGMLQRSRAGLANLLFHELFHSTYYAPGSVDLNENLADFIARKATLQFFENDSAAIRTWLDRESDNAVYSRYILRQKTYLETWYRQNAQRPDRHLLKLQTLWRIADSVSGLPLHEAEKYRLRAKGILSSGNAYFVDFQQYESLQDSLEKVFNKIYGGSIKIFIEHLKRNRINY